MPNKTLANAKNEKNDEFYTQLEDIENELSHYKPHFKDKIVFCNCDDPFESNFFKYFFMNFNSLGLKKLITTSYDKSPIQATEIAEKYPRSLFDEIPAAKTRAKFAPDARFGTPYVCQITREDYDEIKRELKIEFDPTYGDIKELYEANLNAKLKEHFLQILKNEKIANLDKFLKREKQNPKYFQIIKDEFRATGERYKKGDFRSILSRELLKECDIVCTNPPFSLFREYVAQLIEYDKKFLILGNPNAITYKECFKFIKNNQMWLGFKPSGKDMYFNVSDEYKKWLLENKKEGSGYVVLDGKIYGRTAAIWFTNLSHSKRNEPFLFSRKYAGREENYPRYDNYDAIEVSKVADIPEDWDGAMGVPITFLDKYNPDEFEIIALGNSRENFTPNKDYINPKKHLKNGAIKNGGAINCVLALATKTKPIDEVYYTSDNSDFLVPPYARILIKRRKKC